MIVILSSVLGQISLASPGPLDSDYWQEDKKKHASVSAAAASLGYIALRQYEYGKWESLVTSVAVGLLIGTAKEVRDRYVDSDDIKADAAGAILGGGICFTVDLIFF